MENTTENQVINNEKTKFCKHCGAKIHYDAVICTACGRQVEEIKSESQPSIVINNSNDSVNTNVNKNENTVGVAVAGRERNKWVALLLCLFLGYFGAHKFYENKIGMGILYLCTGGLCGIGAIVDIFIILSKPNPYYV